MGQLPSAKAPLPVRHFDSLLPLLALGNLLIPLAFSGISRALHLSGETSGMAVSVHEAICSALVATLLLGIGSEKDRTSSPGWLRTLGASFVFLALADLAYGLFAYVIQLPPPRGHWPVFYELPYTLFSLLSAHAVATRALEGLARREKVLAVSLITLLATGFFAVTSKLILIPIFSQIPARPPVIQLSILAYSLGQSALLGSVLLASLRATGFREFFLWFSFLTLIGSDFAIRMQEFGEAVPNLSFFDYGWHFSVATAASMIALQLGVPTRSHRLHEEPSPLSSLRVVSAGLTLSSLVLFLAITWTVTRTFKGGISPATAAGLGEAILTLAVTWAFANAVSLTFSKMLKKTNARLSVQLTRIQNLDDLSELASAPEEFKGMVEALHAMNARLKVSIEENVRLNSLAAFGAIASQVAHDIRSPLAALEILNQDLTALPEDLRVLTRSAVGRIRDIANDLIMRHRAPQMQTGPRSVQLLSTLITGVVSEKRIQHRARNDLEIESIIDPSAYSLFTEIDPGDFKRTLSNLLNNAIEALPAGRRENHVSVILEKAAEGDDRFLRLTVRDNGRGIPKHILERLGNRGETHGKQDGSGLGLHHAICTVQSFGGSLSIQSVEGEGTRVILTLPGAAAPAWFVPELRLRPHQSILVIDDDPSVHQVWRRRLQGYLQSVPGLTLKTFTRANEFRRWIQTQPNHAMNSMILIDHEFSGTRQNGLDLIEETGLASSVCLVTNRHEEPAVESRVRSMGIGMIPKSMVAYVPISAETPRRPLTFQPRAARGSGSPGSRPDRFRTPAIPAHGQAG